MAKRTTAQTDTKNTDCQTCENARRMFTADRWIDCPHCRPQAERAPGRITIAGPLTMVMGR